MSLIEGRWVVIGAAAATAVVVPMMLLGNEPQTVHPPLQPSLTEIAPPTFAGLSYAVAAPPFDPDRTAGPSGAGEPAAGEPPPPPAPPPPQAPILVGIVSGGGKRPVALAKGADGETQTLSAGGSIGGWRLIAIRRDHAVFDLAGARHTARLDFSNNPATGAAPAPPPPLEAVAAAPREPGNSS